MSDPAHPSAESELRALGLLYKLRHLTTVVARFRPSFSDPIRSYVAGVEALASEAQRCLGADPSAVQGLMSFIARFRGSLHLDAIAANAPLGGFPEVFVLEPVDALIKGFTPSHETEPRPDMSPAAVPTPNLLDSLPPIQQLVERLRRLHHLMSLRVQWSCGPGDLPVLYARRWTRQGDMWADYVTASFELRAKVFQQAAELCQSAGENTGNPASLVQRVSTAVGSTERRLAAMPVLDKRHWDDPEVREKAAHAMEPLMGLIDELALGIREIRALSALEQKGANMSNSIARIYAALFRRLAEQYDRPYTGPLSPAIALHQLDDQAGRAIIDVVDKGLLRGLPELRALVEWVAHGGMHPRAANAEGCPGTEKMQAVLVRSAANVFNEVRGNHLVTVQNRDGEIIPEDQTHGGILPTMLPGLLPPQKLDSRGAGVAEHSVRACIALAELLEAEIEGEHAADERLPMAGKAAGAATAGARVITIDYIDLDQAAALVNRAKRTLERRIKKDRNAPLPKVQGGGGKKSEWEYSTLRPWLERNFERLLPDRPPHLIRGH